MAHCRSSGPSRFFLLRRSPWAAGSHTMRPGRGRARIAADMRTLRLDADHDARHPDLDNMCGMAKSIATYRSLICVRWPTVHLR